MNGNALALVWLYNLPRKYNRTAAWGETDTEARAQILPLGGKINTGTHLKQMLDITLEADQTMHTSSRSELCGPAFFKESLVGLSWTCVLGSSKRPCTVRMPVRLKTSHSRNLKSLLLPLVKEAPSQRSSIKRPTAAGHQRGLSEWCHYHVCTSGVTKQKIKSTGKIQLTTLCLGFAPICPTIERSWLRGVKETASQGEKAAVGSRPSRNKASNILKHYRKWEDAYTMGLQCYFTKAQKWRQTRKEKRPLAAASIQSFPWLSTQSCPIKTLWHAVGQGRWPSCLFF